MLLISVPFRVDLSRITPYLVSHVSLGGSPSPRRKHGITVTGGFVKNTTIHQIIEQNRFRTMLEAIDSMVAAANAVHCILLW